LSLQISAFRDGRTFVMQLELVDQPYGELQGNRSPHRESLGRVRTAVNARARRGDSKFAQAVIEGAYTRECLG
jgi:hypothetical protein